MQTQGKIDFEKTLVQPTDAIIHTSKIWTPHVLVELLHRTAQQKKHSPVMLADKLEVTYGYLSQLTKGFQKMHDTSTLFAKNCAQYLELDVPDAAVMLLSKQILLNNGLSSENSQMIGPFVPAEIGYTSSRTQALMMDLYNKAVRKQLIAPHRLQVLLKELEVTTFIVKDFEAKEIYKDLISKRIRLV